MTNMPIGWENLVNHLHNKEMIDSTTPAFSYPVFLSEATKLFVAKSTDYDDRYLRALIELNAFTIWKWEVDKKLDCLRTWLRRGELQVYGEGIRNSVDDLFVYTVQYVEYIQRVVNNRVDPIEFLTNVRANRKEIFEFRAGRLSPAEWVEFIVKKGLIGEGEYILQLLLRSYMGEEVPVDSWRHAIRETLK